MEDSAAHAQGLGAMWRTGSAARDAAVRDAAGLSPAGRIVAFIHLGTPADGSGGTPATPTAPSGGGGAVPSGSAPRTARERPGTPDDDGDLGIGSLR